MTTLPGFCDPVHDAQTTFRALLDSMAHPGRVYPIPPVPEVPTGLLPTCGAACLTLLDLETSVWLQPHQSAAVRQWLLFHTGCTFVTDSEVADFAIVDVPHIPDLTQFNWGTAADPETSTTLLIQIPDASLSVERGDRPISLTGPGIDGTTTFAADLVSAHGSPLPARFWRDWSTNHYAYPLGIDVFLFDQRSVVGLPRTAQAIHPHS
ncbi:MAG: phosphonate C-P lyase system protein PhnH [Synechococcales bacterium]|nr:phosphonate C-P lyase system protein PhnH [Synechococcales bacterium]